MPSSLHELLVGMFRERPGLAAELLADVLHVDVPPHDQARAGPAEVSAVLSTEHRADAVVVLRDGEHPVGAVVVEVQLRTDSGKRWVWPLYVAAVRARWRCPTVLLVVCADDAVGRWAGAALELGNPGSVLRPTVLLLGALPVVADRETAVRTPEFAVLSALAHAEDDGPLEHLDVLVEALTTIDPERATEYAFLVLEALPERARVHMEDLMNLTEPLHFDNVFTRRAHAEGLAEGHAEGMAAVVLRILAARGIEVAESDRARIAECRDPEQLGMWADRAATASTIDDVLTR